MELRRRSARRTGNSEFDLFSVGLVTVDNTARDGKTVRGAIYNKEYI
jgi:hypothetical protein